MQIPKAPQNPSSLQKDNDFLVKANKMVPFLIYFSFKTLVFIAFSSFRGLLNRGLVDINKKIIKNSLTRI